MHGSRQTQPGLHGMVDWKGGIANSAKKRSSGHSFDTLWYYPPTGEGIH